MGTKVGQNWYQSIHYDVLSWWQVSFTLPQGTPSREEHKRSQRHYYFFNAIPTCWVSKDNSVGLIWLQRRNSDAVAAQRRSIPKCVVKTPAGIITASVLRGYNCAASKSPKMLPRGKKLVWRIFVFMFFHAFFIVRSLLPLAYTKKHCLWLVGHKNISAATIVIF